MSNDIHEKIGRIDERTKLTHNTIMRLEKRFDENNKTYGQRLRILEDFKLKITSYASLVAAVVSTSIIAAWEYINHNS